MRPALGTVCRPWRRCRRADADRPGGRGRFHTERILSASPAPAQRLRYGAERITPRNGRRLKHRIGTPASGRSDIGESASARGVRPALFKPDEQPLLGSHDPALLLVVEVAFAPTQGRSARQQVDGVGGPTCRLEPPPAGGERPTFYHEAGPRRQLSAPVATGRGAGLYRRPVNPGLEPTMSRARPRSLCSLRGLPKRCPPPAFLYSARRPRRTAADPADHRHSPRARRRTPSPFAVRARQRARDPGAIHRRRAMCRGRVSCATPARPRRVRWRPVGAGASRPLLRAISRRHFATASPAGRCRGDSQEAAAVSTDHDRTGARAHRCVAWRL